MANSKIKEAAKETPSVVPEAPVAVPVAKESVYTVEDLIAGFKAFKTSKEIVVVALRQAGKKTATFSEAKNIIDKFKNKEVK